MLMCTRVHTPTHMSEDSQFFRLGSKHIYLLSHLISPPILYKKYFERNNQEAYEQVSRARSRKVLCNLYLRTLEYTHPSSWMSFHSPSRLLPWQPLY